MPEVTLVEAVNLALARALQDDPDVVVFGEDVGVNGGVFRATAGLQKRFGAERVMDAPLSELLISGLCVGMAAQGLKPVGEIQFMGFVSLFEDDFPDWWFDPVEGGGWLGASGSHVVDQIRAWLGEFSSLSANTMLVSDREKVAEDSYSLRFVMENGLEGSMQQTAGAWGPMATMWRCAGTKGTVWADSGKVFVADKVGTRELDVPEDLMLPPPPPAADASGSNRLSHLEIGPFTRLCEALRDGIEGRPAASTVPVPTFRDGLASMRVIDAIRASAANGGRLQTL